MDVKYPVVIFDRDRYRWYYSRNLFSPVIYLAGSDSESEEKAEIMRIGDQILIDPRPGMYAAEYMRQGISPKGMIIPAGAYLTQTFPASVRWKRLSEVMEEGVVYGLDLQPLAWTWTAHPLSEHRLGRHTELDI